MTCWKPFAACLIGVIASWGPQASRDHLRSDGRVPELVVVDLQGDGVNLRPVDGTVWFSYAAGTASLTGWTGKGSDDSFVGLDLTRNGLIDGFSELFGGIGPPNGFEGILLRAGSKGGIIDTDNALFPRLILWNDADHDGQSAPGELQSMAFAGFESLRLMSSVMLEPDGNGNVVTRRGVAVRRMGGRRLELTVVTARLAAPPLHPGR